MYEIEKIFRFEAGHVLIHHDGRCKRPHGHSYVLHVRIRTDALHASGPKTNMAIDFHDISAIVKPMIEQYLDHRWLNDTLNSDSPSAEFIAHWIYQHLRLQLPGLHAIQLWETATASVTYTE